MMPQSQNADYSNGSSNSAVGLALAPQNGQYTSNNSMPAQIHMLNSSVQNQNIMAAAQGYLNPGLATIGYIYPNNNSFVQASNLVFNPHNILHQPVEMITSGPSSLGHIANTGIHHSHKLSGYDSMQHFGSLSQNPSRKPKNSVMSKTNLYINGLQESDTDETVRALVEGIIDPKSCKAMMSHGKCRGSGFIDCANENDAETVIHILRNKQMPGGTRLAVKFAYENEKDDLNVYVRNLPRTSSFNNTSLEDMFREYGQVVSVKLLQSDNQYTGTGFVRFSAAEEAQKAVDQMNAKKFMLTEEDKPVICKLADKGGRRMNHSLMGYGGEPVIQGTQSMDGGGEHMVNGTMSPEGADKAGYSMSVMAGHQYAPQAAHGWLSQSNNDYLTQELQSLSLASSGSYLMPGLMQGALTMPYNDEVALQQQQQQQLLAQLFWAQQSPQRMMAAPAIGTATGPYHAPSQLAHHHHHQQQQQQAQQQAQQQQQQHAQAQSILHWPPAHHPQITANNNGLFYTTDSPYQATLVYPPPQPPPPLQQQYRHSRPPLATNTTLKSTSAIEPTINGQASSNQQPLMNGCVVLDQQQHQLAKM